MIREIKQSRYNSIYGVYSLVDHGYCLFYGEVTYKHRNNIFNMINGFSHIHYFSGRFISSYIEVDFSKLRYGVNEDGLIGHMEFYL